MKIIINVKCSTQNKPDSDWQIYIFICRFGTKGRGLFIDICLLVLRLVSVEAFQSRRPEWGRARELVLGLTRASKTLGAKSASQSFRGAALLYLHIALLGSNSWSLIFPMLLQQYCSSSRDVFSLSSLNCRVGWGGAGFGIFLPIRESETSLFQLP